MRRLQLAAVLGLLILCVTAAAFWIAGGRWVTVKTPSMAQTAPVGTLLLTRPLGQQPLTAGEFIVFHPPTSPKQTYAHRIFSIAADGSMRTKGDLNDAVDPWTLHRSDVSGHVVLRLWGLGWLLKVLPILIVGTVVVFALCRWRVRASTRLPVEVLLMSLLVAGALVWQRPLARADLLYLQSDHGSAHATMVSTGLLPVRVHAPNAGSIVLRAGQDGVLTGNQPPGGKLFRVDVGVHFTPWLWVLLICCWLVPLAVLLMIGTARRSEATVAALVTETRASRVRRGSGVHRALAG